MRKHFTKLPAVLLSLVLLFSSLPAIPVSAETGAAEITIENGAVSNIQWNIGYVGSSTNVKGNVNKIATSENASSTYRYTDVFTVPKAGTTLSWSDSTKPVSEGAYIVSSWKLAGSEWVIDLDGTNIAGGTANNNDIITEVGSVTTYTYTTAKDNEHLRLCCFGTVGVADGPTVRAGNSVVSESGTLDNILWFSGYVGSNQHNNANSRDAIALGKELYSYSAPILLAKAGTTIQFSVTKDSTITQFASHNAYVFSIWERESDSSFAFGYGMAGNTTANTAWQTISGDTCTYFYKSSYDNEYIRLCYRSEAAANTLPTTTPAVTVTENGSGDAILSLAYYDPANYEYIRSVKWNDSYVGSDTNTSCTNKILSVEDKDKPKSDYKYSDIITVYGKGSLVMFTDSSTGFCSNSAYCISSWESSDNTLTTVDTTGSNIKGEDSSHYTINPDGSRTYYYYTTKDVEYLRLCLRSDGGNRGTVNTSTSSSFIEPSVYVTAAATLVTWNPGYYILGNPDADWGDGLYSVNKNTSFTYSSYFTLPQKGTSISIPLLSSSSENIAVFSTYDAENVASGQQAIGPKEGTYTTVGATRIYTYTTTRDNEILRLCTNSNYSNTTGNSFLPVLATTLGSYSELFSGKEMVIIGDSYFAGNGINRDKVWPKRFAELYDMSFYNYGINGSTVSNYVTTKDPMVDRFSSMAGGADTALVLFEGGRNDYNVSVPLGTLGDTDSRTFYGALYTMITGLLQKYPNALIVCLNAWDLTGCTQNSDKGTVTCNEYAAAFRDLVNSFKNDRLIMLNSNSTEVVPVYVKEAKFRAAYGQTPVDISHMNAKGMAFALPYFEALLGGFMSDYTAATAAGSIRFVENGTTMRLVSTAKDGSATVMAPMLESTDFIGWGGKIHDTSVFLPAGGTLSFSANDSGELTPYYLEMSGAGNSIRLTPDSTGIRFLTRINEKQYNTIAALQGVSLAQGTLIVPQQYLAALGGSLTFEALEETGKQYIDVKTSGFYSSDGSTAIMAGSVANIFRNHYALDYVGQGYVTVTYTDSTSRTFYAKNATTKAVTVYSLADTAQKDRSATPSERYAYLTADDDYSPYTNDQHKILAGFTSIILNIQADTSADSGYTATQSGSTTVFIVTKNEDQDQLQVARADGTDIDKDEFAGVIVCGVAKSFTLVDGKLNINYSEYTDPY